MNPEAVADVYGTMQDKSRSKRCVTNSLQRIFEEEHNVLIYTEIQWIGSRPVHTVGLYTFSKRLKEVIALLNSDATQQMLIYSLGPNFSFDNSVHNSFQEAYDQLGFPQQCQNIAISNGSNSGSSLFNPGANIINYSHEESLKWWQGLLLGYLNGIPGGISLKIRIEINALKNQVAHKIYQGRVYYEKKILWFIPVTTDIMSVTVYSQSSMLALDGALGGVYDINGMSGGSLPFDSASIKQNRFCFIPTVSSLAINNWEAMLSQNPAGVTGPLFRPRVYA